MIFEIERYGKLAPIGDGELDPDVVDKMTDRLMESLLELEPDAIDPGVSGELANGKVIIRMGVEETSPSAALAKADVLVRSALHAAGITTPEWNESKKSLSFQDGAWHVTPSSVVEALVEAG